MLIKILKEMFNEMVVKKDPSLIPKYYHPDFLLFTNEETMDYEAFLKSHQKFYSTPIQYEVEYDEKTFLEQGDKLAGRMWITTKRPKESATKIEVILIIQFKEQQLYRLWELTYPDWSNLPPFLNK
jgi:hypothetical protein